MATVEELRGSIATAEREYTEERERVAQIERAIAEAHERQRLRRELERVQSLTASQRSENAFMRRRQGLIDDDLIGDVPDDRPVRAPPRPIKNNKEVMSCCKDVSTGVYLWKIEGLSWLVSTLKQNGEPYAESDFFHVGGEAFTVVYNPRTDEAFGPDGRRQRASLAIMHHDDEGLTLRYRFFVKNAEGNFIQWGESGDECQPDDDTCGWVFGPDVRTNGVVASGVVKPFGIYGLTHKELLQSEWVTADALTVKVEVEVRSREEPMCAPQSDEPQIEVPAAALGAHLLSLFEDGKSTDVTFIVDKEPIRAHSQILCARSEVFDRQLNIGMRESASREIVVEDCDITTFKALLRFLYSDDLGAIEETVNATCSVASSSASGGDAVGGGGGGSLSVISKRDGQASARLSLIQSLLAVSHKYQVSRLRLWCEQQLCKNITVCEFCSVLSQAHLYDAKQLEQACLSFIKVNMEDVVVTSAFGALGRDWPGVVLKINLFCAGVSKSEATAALETQRQAPCLTTAVKRKRTD
jgi:speckle-type POZ protein